LPVFRNRVVFEVAQGVRAFLNLEAGATRGAIPEGFGDLSSESATNVHQELQQAQQKLAERNQRLQSVRRREARKEREIAKLRAGSASDPTTPYRGVRPENIIWIFGIGRSGNTWLSSMMGEMKDQVLWPEPCVGELFGDFYYSPARERQRGARNFILGEPEQNTWTKSMRLFLLNEVEGRFGNRAKYLVVKEQRGSLGAPLLLQALPESRMVFLIRDPRDVVASNLDAFSKEGWAGARNAAADRSPDEFVRTWAERYMQNVGAAKQAYETHTGRKAKVRYEELNNDTHGTMNRLYSDLGIPVDEAELSRVVKQHSWENVPEDKKGAGKFYRKASPGSWRNDLTPEQVRIVEKETAALMEEFYSDEGKRHFEFR
jgi:hypothetical protein